MKKKNELELPQCARCVHGRRNRGLVIPQADANFFCGRVARVKDEEVLLLLEPILKMLAAKHDCPHFDQGVVTNDSYLSSEIVE